jgi:hypothetical protein
MMQMMEQNSGGDYLLQKKIEVMLDLQYKKIKNDIDQLKASVDNLAQEMMGLRSAMKKEAYAAESHTAQSFQQTAPQQAMQQQAMQQPVQMMQQQAMQPQQAMQQTQQPAQSPTASGQQAAYQQNLTSNDVSIEKFFNFGKKR